jgi:hypothetical protein
MVDELCEECGGIGVVKGTPAEEEQEFQQRRQRNLEELERKGAAGRARRGATWERRFGTEKANRSTAVRTRLRLRSQTGFRLGGKLGRALGEVGRVVAALAVFGVIVGVGFGLSEHWFGVGTSLLERRLHQYTLLGEKVVDKQMGGLCGCGRVPCNRRERGSLIEDRPRPGGWRPVERAND